MAANSLPKDIANINVSLAKISQKLDTDYTAITRIDAQCKDHEVRITKLETVGSTAFLTLSRIGLVLLNCATLLVAILALLKK